MVSPAGEHGGRGRAGVVSASTCARLSSSSPTLAATHSESAIAASATTADRADSASKVLRRVRPGVTTDS